MQRDRVIYALRHYVRGTPASTNGLVFLFDLECWGYSWIFPFIRNGERSHVHQVGGSRAS